MMERVYIEIPVGVDAHEVAALLRLQSYKTHVRPNGRVVISFLGCACQDVFGRLWVTFDECDPDGFEPWYVHD